MDIIIVPRDRRVPSSGVSTAYLHIDRWNDFSFVTMFYLSLFDEKGERHSIGNVKIGFRGQITDKLTHRTLLSSFKMLPDGYFSVGQDVEYYKKLSALSDSLKKSLLESIKDMAYQPDLINLAKDEEVFRTSLLRDVSLSVIKGQFANVLAGRNPLTNFMFKFVRPAQEKMSGIELSFDIDIDAKPSTNIHAIIGRNGVGKTTLLNGMIEAVTSKEESFAKFYDIAGRQTREIDNSYFSSLVSVSFSAFDPFEPPNEQHDPSKGTCYFYIGLQRRGGTLKEPEDIHDEFVQSVKSCFSQVTKRKRWIEAINTLESDENFSEMELQNLAQYTGDVIASEAKKRIKKMSSGHAIVLLTITRLVSTVEEKTLVLIDEPESHLHPPLLSAFIRALSDLLLNRNAVSSLATHSPVVLQEIPKKCVWKINRSRLETDTTRPAIETFGENVGILTREVFGLEVVKSGFHDLLSKSVESGATFQEIVAEYGDQLGVEARALLKAMVVHRDRSLGL